MNCENCGSLIVNTINHIGSKNKYIKLFRKLFPKRPITIKYCTNCYNIIGDELEIEYNSQIEHINSYNKELETLKEKTWQDYSIIDNKENSKTTQKYVVLDEKNDEYKDIKKRFEETLSFKIIRIEKNNNPVLDQKFQERSQKLSCQNIKYLFHGSNDKAYDNILETGFDLEYSSPHGLLGKGIYFAEDASYSHGYGKITKTNIGKVNHLLYCKVNLGKTTKGSTGLLDTPPGYDAVHSDGRTYATFHNYQGVPLYIIYYLVEDK